MTARLLPIQGSRRSGRSRAANISCRISSIDAFTSSDTRTRLAENTVPSSVHCSMRETALYAFWNVTPINVKIMINNGHSVPQAVVVGFPPRQPGIVSRSHHLGLMVDTMARGQNFPSQFSFHQQLHIHISSCRPTLRNMDTERVLVVPVFNCLNTTPWIRMGSGGIAPPILTLELDGSKWWASLPGSFIPGERDSGVQCVGDRVCPRADLDAVG
jgi:hypothetical protein